MSISARQNEHSGKLILIADDFREIQQVYAHFLTQKGFRVATANDGQEALDKAFELHPDLILMDLSLPVINGWAATRQLKENEKTKHIPVVILTAHGAEVREAILEEGCEGFLTKPTLPEVLLEEVRRVLRCESDKVVRPF